MATVQNPPYQDPQGSQRWADWFRDVKLKVEGVTTSINFVDDVTVAGAETDDFLVWTTNGLWENQTSAQAVEALNLAAADSVTFGGLDIEGNGDVEGTLNADVITIAGASLASVIEADEHAHVAAEVTDFVTAGDAQWAEVEHSHVASEVVTATDTATAADHEVAADERYILVNTSSNTVTVDLLTPATAGDGYRLDVKLIDATNALTIEGTIDESADLTGMALYDSVSLLCDGNEYWII